jgi:peptidoglycan/LPS O-acetylase OafA/YrhL
MQVLCAWRAVARRCGAICSSASGQHLSLRPVVQRILLASAMLLLITVAWAALSGGLHQLPRSHTLGQRVETTVQFAGGLLSLMGVLTCFRWRRWGPPVRAAWAISLTIAAGLSSVVWGPPSLIVGLVFAAGALLLALAIIWLLRAGLAASPAPASSGRSRLEGRVAGECS